MTGQVQELTKESFWESIGTGTVLVDVWGPDCAPCVALRPHVEALAALRPDVTVAALEAPKARRVCIELRLMGLPAFLIFRDGVEVGRLAGGPIDAARIRSFLEEHAGAPAEPGAREGVG
jgi:thioredoxin-like negative regulator of GroEL